MRIQMVFVALFVLNMVLIWSAKLAWYRVPGFLIFLVTPFLMVFSRQPRFELDHFWWRVAGIAAMAIGLGIALWAGIEFKKASMRVSDPPREMITTGPYHFVRHPQYVGLIFMWVGWWWVWSAVYAFYFGMLILILIWIEAYLEEKFILEKKFGEQYRKYRAETGMFWIK